MAPRPADERVPNPLWIKIQVLGFLAAALMVAIFLGISYLVLNIKINAEKLLTKRQILNVYFNEIIRAGRRLRSRVQTMARRSKER